MDSLHADPSGHAGEPPAGEGGAPGERLAFIGFKQACRTLGTLRAYPQMLLFLVAHLLHTDGIQTVIPRA